MVNYEVSKGPVNNRTRAMLDRVEMLAAPSDELVVIQGFNDGDKSAGTHLGWGVVDVRVWNLTGASRYRVLLWMRVVGFAAWLRTEAQGFDPHIHGCAMGDPGMPAAAKRQVTAYKAGKNGLANNGPDDGPLGYTNATWEKFLAANPEGIMADEADKINANIDNFEKVEAARYARYEAIHQEEMAAIARVQKTLDGVVAKLK